MLKIAIIAIACGIVISVLVFKKKNVGVQIAGGLSISAFLFGVFLLALIIGGDR